MLSRHSARSSHRARRNRPTASSTPESRRRGYEMEWLERRTLLSFPPSPIIPDKGESNLLEQAKKFEDKLNLNALDHFPIPFAVIASHADGPPVVAKNNPHSGAPMRVNIDVDSDPTTGKGGKDVSVQVSTELFEGNVFNPHHGHKTTYISN